MEIASAYRFCEDIIKAHSRSFYTAYKDLPLSKRQAVFAVYAFCRKVDDAIDDHSDLNELAVYERWLELIETGKNLDEPIFIALQDSVKRYRIPLKPFRDMIVGQRMDAIFSQPRHEKELLEYCYHVASTVGLMLLPILAEKNQHELTDSAIVLGYAMQLTNILRDIGEDARKGRIYLPSDKLNSPAAYAIETSTVNPDFIKIWEDWAQKAEAYYEQASDQIYLFDEESRLPMMQSLVYYKAILNAVRHANYDCLTKRQSVSDFLGCQSEIKQRLRKVNTHE